MFGYTFAFLYFQGLLTSTLFLSNLDKEHKGEVKSLNKKSQWDYELVRKDWKSSGVVTFHFLYEMITWIKCSMPMASLLPCRQR